MFHDSIAANKFSQLKQQFRFNVCVETGTHEGHGSLNAAKYCGTVITCEINEAHRDKAITKWVHAGYSVKERQEIVLAASENGLIFSYLKSSPVLLHDILPDLKGPACFYLDAHWGEYWPLLDELKEISQWVGKDDCVIIIHDFKVPGKNWGYDNHGGIDLDLNYVKPSLDRINSKFKLFYNEEASENFRGILYATP